MFLADKAGLLFHDMVAPGDLDALNTMVSLPSARTFILGVPAQALQPAGGGSRRTPVRPVAQRDAAISRPSTRLPSRSTLSTIRVTTSPIIRCCPSWPVPSRSGPNRGTRCHRLRGAGPRVADIARQEYQAVGIRVALHPQIDLATEPRWPRISQTFGEDADLTARLAVAYIRGFQGETLGPESVATMAKHFPGAARRRTGTTRTSRGAVNRSIRVGISTTTCVPSGPRSRRGPRRSCRTTACRSEPNTRRLASASIAR